MDMENLNLNLPPFYVGQKVVVIKDHSQGAFKKSDEFTVLAVKKMCCQWCIYIGLKGWRNINVCNICGNDYQVINLDWWFASKIFAPIESTFQSISFAEVIKIESPLIGAN